MTATPLVTVDQIDQARARIAPLVVATPLTHADALSRLTGADVWVKEEQRQRTGSFKIRGAFNHLAQLPPGSAVVAASAGNHAQGVALAASHLRMPATIFMPLGASLPKVRATEDYGATVRLDGDTLEDAFAAAAEFARRTQAALVPPFDDPHVIAGQGTIGLEIIELLPNVETVVVPIGGGGLVSGIAAAVRARAPQCRIVGVEAAGAASMAASVAARRPVQLTSAATIADGIAVKAPSELTLAHVRALVDDVVAVDDEQIGEALVAILERGKSVVEPSGAVALAALMARAFHVPTGPIALIQSGGNVDLLLLSRLIEHGLSVAGRYLRLRIDLPDRPGSLARIAADLAALGLNILTVDHHRERASLDVDEVEIAVTVETRGVSHRDTALAELAARGWNARVY